MTAVSLAGDRTSLAAEGRDGRERSAPGAGATIVSTELGASRGAAGAVSVPSVIGRTIPPDGVAAARGAVSLRRFPPRSLPTLSSTDPRDGRARSGEAPFAGGAEARPGVAAARAVE